MNTDPTPLDPDEAARRDAALRATEARLRRTLGAEAARIEPNDRLAAILTEAHGETPVTAARRWLAPAAAAAAALLLAGTVWAVNRPTGTTPVGGPTVASDSAGTSTAPAPSTTPGTTTPSSTGTSPQPVEPVPDRDAESRPTAAGESHRAAADGHGAARRRRGSPCPSTTWDPWWPGSEQLRLFREFVPDPVPAPGDGRGQGPGRPAAGVRRHRLRAGPPAMPHRGSPPIRPP